MLLKKFFLYITLICMIAANIPYTVLAETETTTESVVSDSTSETTTALIDTHGIDTDISINAEACILIDADTGVVLYEKNSHEVLYPASITKIMTVLLACEEGNLSDTVVHSENAVFGIGEGSSHIGMDVGEEVNFEDALYGILLESANEVCMAIAEHIDGTVEKFVDRMNEKAAELGCKDTHFANPHGYHDDNHYTTCYDMALITKAAVQNEEFLKIFSTVDHTIPPTNKNVERYLHNKDKQMRPTSPYYYENIIGGKTGFHDQALNTLVSYAGKDDVKLISVVMKDNGAALAYEDSAKLLDYGFSIYENKTLVASDSYTGEIPVIQNYKEKVYDLGTVSLKLEEDYAANVPSFIDASQITVKPQLNENIQAPVEVGTDVGSLDVYYGDYLIGTAKIVAATGIDAVPESDLEHQERMENLKAFALKVLKIVGIVAAAAAVIIILLIAYFKLRGGRRRRKKIYSYSGRYGTAHKNMQKRNNKRRRVKYKIRIK